MGTGRIVDCVCLLCGVLLVAFEVSAEQTTFARRAMTDEEFLRLQARTGTYVEGTDYNRLIDGHGTGLRPPTAEEWEEIRRSPCLIDPADADGDGAPPDHDNSAMVWFPPIGNQDGEGSCVSWACGYYTKTFQEAREHNWNLSGCLWEGGYYGNPSPAYQHQIFSPDFIYHQVNNGVDNGSYYSDNMNLLERIGGCTWDRMPYDPTSSTEWPDEDAWRQAPRYRSLTGYGYMWVQTDPALEALKDLLADTNLAVISINANYYSDMTDEDLWTLDNYNPSTTNHANTIVGYNNNYGPYSESGDTATYGAFKVANSWGVGGWENAADGFYYISYECMKQRVENIFFYENMMAYEPEMIALFRLSHDSRGECQTTLAIGTIGWPFSSKRFDDYNYNGGDHPYPSNVMVVDITEFVPHMIGPPDNFYLQVYDGGTATLGSIDSFFIEIYDDYGSGTPTAVYVSTDPPVGTVNYANVYAEVSTDQATLLVTSPDGGEDWACGSDQAITWSTTGGISSVQIEYSTDGGTGWTTVIPSTPDDGSYTWTIPNTPSVNCLVRVSDSSTRDPSDESDAPFTLSDQTPPSQVLGLQATTDDSSVFLTWVPASDNIGVDHYLVYRDTLDDFVPHPGSSVAATTDLFYMDFDVEPGMNYYYRVSAVDSSQNEGAYSDDVSITLPTSVEIAWQFEYSISLPRLWNYPNPAGSSSEITYILAKDCHARIEIFNMLGERVARLADERHSAGRRSVRWDARAEPSGLYICRLETFHPDGSLCGVWTRQIVLVK